MKWIDANDELPEINKHVLVITLLCNNLTITHAYLNSNKEWKEVCNYTTWSADWGHGGGENDIYDPVLKWTYSPEIPTQT